MEVSENVNNVPEILAIEIAAYVYYHAKTLDQPGQAIFYSHMKSHMEFDSRCVPVGNPLWVQ